MQTEADVEEITKRVGTALKVLLVDKGTKYESEVANVKIKAYWVGKIVRIDLA